MTTPQIAPEWRLLLDRADGALASTATLRAGLSQAEVATRVAESDSEHYHTTQTGATGRVAAADLANEGESGEYVILGRLGRGGMGDVLLAQQRRLGRDVAVKTIRGQATEDRVHRFGHESRVTASLEHPLVIPVHDAGDDYLVMRRVDGMSLERRLRDSRPDDLPDLIEILARVADGLDFAHQQGFIHRDLKPANVMLGDYGEVYLLDWGLALALWPHQGGLADVPTVANAASICAGTPAYLPPETARGDRDQIGIASDAFLLGGLLYRMLSGRTPFLDDGPSRTIARAAACDYQPVAELNPDAPRDLIALQQALMTPTAAERISVGAARTTLREWLQEAGDRAAAAKLIEQAHAIQAAPDVDYAGHEQAVRLAVQARGHWPDGVTILSALSTIRTRYLEAATVAGDLTLARTLVRHEDRRQAHVTAIVALEAAEQHAAQALVHARRARRRGLIAVVGSLLAVTALGWFQARSAAVAQTQREQAAAALAAHAEKLEPEESLPLYERAVGLADGPWREARDQRHVALIQSAFDANDLDRARYHLAALDDQHPQLDLLASQLATAERAAVQTLASQRVAGLGQLLGIWRGPTVIDDAVTWQREAQQTVANLQRSDTWNDDDWHTLLRQFTVERPSTNTAALAVFLTAAHQADLTWQPDDWQRFIHAVPGPALPHLARFGPPANAQALSMLLRRLAYDESLSPPAAALVTAWLEPRLDRIVDYAEGLNQESRRQLLRLVERLAAHRSRYDVARRAADLLGLDYAVDTLAAQYREAYFNRQFKRAEQLALQGLDTQQRKRFLYALLQVYYRTNQFEKVLAYADEIGQHPTSRTYYAWALANIGAIDEAVVELEAIVAHPDFSANDFEHGFAMFSAICRAVGRSDLATAVISTAHIGDDAGTWDYLNHARAHHQRGDYDRAIEATYLATERWPRFHWGYATRAQFLAELGLHDEADQAIQIALGLYGREAGMLLMHALVLHAAGQDHEAAHRVTMAKRMQPNNALRFASDGVLAYTHSGSEADAAEAYQHLTNNDPVRAMVMGNVRFLLDRHAVGPAIQALTDAPVATNAVDYGLIALIAQLSAHPDVAYPYGPSEPRQHTLLDETWTALTAIEPDPQQAEAFWSAIQLETLEQRRHVEWKLAKALFAANHTSAIGHLDTLIEAIPEHLRRGSHWFEWRDHLLVLGPEGDWWPLPAVRRQPRHRAMVPLLLTAEEHQAIQPLLTALAERHAERYDPAILMDWFAALPLAESPPDRQQWTDLKTGERVSGSWDWPPAAYRAERERRRQQRPNQD